MSSLEPAFAGRDSIYLDYNASTPCDPRVVEAMLPALTDCYANPSSAHTSGRRAARLVKDSRERLAEVLSVSTGEIVFTSGASESNNTAITGAALHELSREKRRWRILVSALEHKSVLKPARALERLGFRTEMIGATPDGLVDLEMLSDLLDENVLLVCVQAANNELGTIQPLSEVWDLAAKYGAHVHADAAQLLGKSSVTVREIAAESIALSSHKLYGPKGIGALVLRGGPRRAAIDPLLRGGGQEFALRAGTENVPGIVGFAKAVELSVAADGEVERLRTLRNVLESALLTSLPRARVLGAGKLRLANTSYVFIPGLDGDAVVARSTGVDLATGSACESGAPEPSHVAQAVGLSRHDADGCLRLSLGRYTSAQDIEVAAKRLLRTITEILAVSTPAAEPEREPGGNLVERQLGCGL